MKPRTRIQKEVVRLSSGLPELTDKQKAYAFEHCFKHHAYRTKGGTITCSECGHRWKGGHTLAETICGCSCPHCGKELEILDTRKRVFRGSAYYEIITTRKGYQVLRYFMVGATYKVGQKAEYSIREVVHFSISIYTYIWNLSMEVITWHPVFPQGPPYPFLSSHWLCGHKFVSFQCSYAPAFSTPFQSARL